MSMITRINSAGQPQLLSASGDEWLDITDTEMSEILTQQQQLRRQQWAELESLRCERRKVLLALAGNVAISVMVLALLLSPLWLGALLDALGAK